MYAQSIPENVNREATFSKVARVAEVKEKTRK